MSAEDEDAEEIGTGIFEISLCPSSLRTFTSNYVRVEDNTCTFNVYPWISPDFATKVVKHTPFQHLIISTWYNDEHEDDEHEEDHFVSAIAVALQEKTTLQRVEVCIRDCCGQSLVFKIVKHNRTLQHLVLDLRINAQEMDRYLSAIADALQENATLQRVEVRSRRDISQHRAFSLDRRLVWINSSL